MRKFIIFLFVLLGLSITDSPANFRLTYPNGGEKFIVGSDTLITWEGISPTDTVKLEYSIDKGVSWRLISDKATGLKHVWKNIPLPVSDECLIKIKPVTKGDSSRFEPAIEWQKTYGGSGNQGATSIQQTSDNGYITAGWTNSRNGDITDYKGKDDAWVLKLDKLGNMEWQKNYGGTSWDLATSIQQTMDGGYVFGGYTMSDDYDVSRSPDSFTNWIVKLDAIGSIEWQKTYNNPLLDIVWSIQQTNDSGYITANKYWGEASHLIYKLDKTGALEWQKYFIEKKDYEVHKIIQTPDGGYIGAGWSLTTNPRDANFWIFKLDSLGNLEWDKTFGGSLADMALSIQLTKEGGYIVVGLTGSTDGDVTINRGVEDCWVLKLDKFGNIEWQKTYGGSSFDEAYSVQQTNDGGYIFTGMSSSNDGDIPESKRNFLGTFIIKINEKGVLNWAKTLYGDTYLGDNSIRQTKDGGYIKAGSTGVENHLIDCDPKGLEDLYIVKLGPGLQYDTSDSVFSIVSQQAFSNDIDMKKSFVGTPKDSIITNFVYNAGKSKFQVDSIYFRGADAGAFSIQSAFPKYSLEPKEGKDTKFRFIPTRVGIHTAEIVLIAQKDTLVQKIKGRGFSDEPEIESMYKPFDDLICGNTNNNQIPITNIGGKPLVISELNLIGANADEFWIVESLPIIVDPKKTEKITVYFTPKSIGTKTAYLEIVSNALPDKIFKAPLNATKEFVDLAFVEDTVRLGYLCPDEAKVMAVNIQNIGTLASRGTLSSSSKIVLSGKEFYLSVNESVGITFKFKGSKNEGDIDEIITLSDTICHKFKMIHIIGKVAIPKIEAKDVSISTMVNVAKQAVITIHNTGERDVTIANPPVLFPSLTWVGNQFPATIKAKDSTEFLIEFLPFDIQSFSLMITFFADQCDIKQNVNIQLLADMPPPKLIVSIKNDSAYAGQVRRLKLMMSNIEPEDIAAYAPNFSAKIRVQKTILTPLKKGDRNIVNDSIYMNVKGTFGTSYELAQIPVVAGLGNVEETSIDIVDFSVKDNAGNKIDTDLEIDTQSGLFKLLGICREGGTRLINPTGKTEIMQIIPNPASDDIEIKVNLIEEGFSTVSVFNSNGVKLREYSFQDGIGLKTININARDFDNGLYFIQLLTPTVVDYQKLMIVK